MAQHAVHWHEGMFLRPHHFQAAGRHFADQLRLASQWDNAYHWGIREISIDRAALRNSRLVVDRLTARLRDGTLVVVPEGSELPEISLAEVLKERQSTAVYLAVPTFQLSKANVGNVDARWKVEKTRDKTADANTGSNPRDVEFLRLNLRLLTENDNLEGYETLLIARVDRSSADGVPQLDATSIPPVLACESWDGLKIDVIRAVYDLIGNRVKFLAEKVRTGGITFDSNSPGDRKIFETLRVLNGAYTYWRIASAADGIHPLPAYLEMVRLVGELAVNGADPEPPELPEYDHDRLGHCFYQVKKYLEELLRRSGPSEGYFERVFLGDGLRMGVYLDKEWFAQSWQMFVGVKSAQLSTDECVKLLKPGRLDMKIASFERVDEIYRAGLRGLRFSYTPDPPRVLPKSPELTYFQVDRASEPEEWTQVENTLRLALRLNERLIEGNISGRRMLKIRSEGLSAEMQFTLYVVPPSLK